MRSSGKRKRPIIIIADPDEEERALMRAILKLVGFQVIEATHADQVVKLARRQSPDLLVLDLMLPGLNGSGVESIRKKATLPDFPIVAVSSQAKDVSAPASMAPTVVLSKPVEYEKFYALIDRFLPGQLTAFARSRCIAL
jgi:DNA-binding response OmpR family regulator